MVARLEGKPIVDERLKSRDVLWRYLDLAKFLDIIINRRLFFQRGDQLPDKFEGSFTASLKNLIETAYKENNIDSSYDEFKTKLRERVFLNCWHKNRDDSMAMWSIYGRSEMSLAITTTVGKLNETLISAKIPHKLSIVKIDYVNHWRGPDINLKPYSNVFSYKVKAYDFEKEVRIIIDRFPENYESDFKEKGMLQPVQPDRLLRSIVVSPEAQPWFHDLVEKIVTNYVPDVPVRRSKLTSEPI